MVYEEAKTRMMSLFSPEPKSREGKQDITKGFGFSIDHIIGPQGPANILGNAMLSKASGIPLPPVYNFGAPSHVQETEEDNLLADEEDAKAMETRRFGTHNNAGLLKNIQTTQSNSSQLENAIDSDLQESTPVDNSNNSFPNKIMPKK